MKKRIITMILITALMTILPFRAEARSVINMGEFKLTAYCPCQKCSDHWGRQTRSGKTATAYHTVAADLSIMNLGDRITINGEEYVVEDCGSGVVGDHLDIFFETHEEVEAFGVRYGEVLIWR